MKATVKAFVESGLFPRSLELLLVQKDGGHNLNALSNDERIQTERKDMKGLIPIICEMVNGLFGQIKKF